MTITARAIPGALCALIAIGGAGFLASSPGSTNSLGRFETSLKGRTRNQRHNAELAMRKIDGLKIAPGGTFSFNAAVGSFSRDQGFRKAPVSYNGQLVNGWGGGVCQTSTTLYNAALLAGLEVVERSRHRFSPSYAPPGRDAAVAFNNIDLKLKNPYPFELTIRAITTERGLDVGISGRGSAPQPQIVSEIRHASRPNTVTLTRDGSRARVRNTGKEGFDVVVYRIWPNRRELISSDAYPVMHRVVEYESDAP